MIKNTIKKILGPINQHRDCIIRNFKAASLKSLRASIEDFGFRWKGYALYFCLVTYFTGYLHPVNQLQSKFLIIFLIEAEKSVVYYIDLQTRIIWWRGMMVLLYDIWYLKKVIQTVKEAFEIKYLSTFFLIGCDSCLFVMNSATGSQLEMIKKYKTLP